MEPKRNTKNKIKTRPKISNQERSWRWTKKVAQNILQNIDCFDFFLIFLFLFYSYFFFRMYVHRSRRLVELIHDRPTTLSSSYKKMQNLSSTRYLLLICACRGPTALVKRGNDRMAWEQGTSKPRWQSLISARFLPTLLVSLRNYDFGIYLSCSCSFLTCQREGPTKPALRRQIISRLCHGELEVSKTELQSAVSRCQFVAIASLTLGFHVRRTTPLMASENTPRYIDAVPPEIWENIFLHAIPPPNRNLGDQDI